MSSSIVGVRVRPSDLVAVWLPPGPRWPQLLEAIWQTGAAMLPLDHRLALPEVARALRQTRPTVLVTATEAVDKIQTTAESHHRIIVGEVMGRDE